MSTLRVNNIHFNQFGNAVISAVNTSNIVITVDGTEMLKASPGGINISGPMSLNGTPLFGGSGQFISTINLASQVFGVLNVSSGGTGLSAVGTSGNVLTSNGTSWISQAPAPAPASNTISAPNFTGNIDANGSVRYAITALTGNTVNCAQGNYFTRTSSGAASWFINNIPTNRTYTFFLELTNGGSGTQTWFANTRWAGGTAPTLTASGVDVIGFVTDDGGANWRGVALMTDSK